MVAKEGLKFTPTKGGCVVSGNTFKHKHWLGSMTARSLGVQKGAVWKPQLRAWFVPTEVFPAPSTVEYKLLCGEKVKEEEVKAETTPSPKQEWVPHMLSKIQPLYNNQDFMTAASHMGAQQYIRTNDVKGLLWSLGSGNGRIPTTLSERWSRWVAEVAERDPETAKMLGSVRVGCFYHDEDAKCSLTEDQMEATPQPLMGEDIESFTCVTQVKELVEKLIIRAKLIDYRHMCGSYWGLCWLIDIIEQLDASVCEMPTYRATLGPYPPAAPEVDRMESWDIEGPLRAYELEMIIRKLCSLYPGHSIQRASWMRLLASVRNQ